MRSLLLFALFILLPFPLLRADTILLKSGEKLDGKVVKETDTELTVEYKVTASITDLRTIARADLDKIEKAELDEAAYQALKTVKPGPNSYPAASYDVVLKRLQAFVDQYPKSAHQAEIGTALAGFAEEKVRVDNGEIKLGGQWISKEQAEKEKYQLGGRQWLAQMEDLARRGDLPGALNSFDALEKQYPGSAAWPQAIDEAKPLLNQLKTNVERAQQNWQVQKQEREIATKGAAEPQRSELIAAQKQEQAQADAAIEAAKAGGQNWPPFLARSDKALAALAARAATETKRIALLPVAKMRESLKAAEKARAALEAKDLATADSSLKEAQSLWGVNELSQRLQKDLNAAKTAAAKATPVPQATPVAAATATPKASPAAKPAIATAATTKPAGASDSEEPKKPFFSTPPGMALGLVVLGALVYVYLKTRGKRENSERAELEAQIAERERIEEERKRQQH